MEGGRPLEGGRGIGLFAAAGVVEREEGCGEGDIIADATDCVLVGPIGEAATAVDVGTLPAADEVPTVEGMLVLGAALDEGGFSDFSELPPVDP